MMNQGALYLNNLQDIIDKYFVYDKKIELEVAPFAYVRRVKSDVWKKRKVVEEYYSKKNYLSLLLNRINYKQGSSLKIVFLMPIPKLSNRKMKLLENTFCDKRPDLDNLIKAFLDAACIEDNYISYIQAMKIYSFTPKIIILQ